MKRDMNLVRKLLLFVETLPESDEFSQFASDDYTERQVEYHALMLVEQGLLKRDGVFVEAEAGISFICDALTFGGHDFLDAARDDTIWRKAMDKVATTTGGVTIDVLKAVLIDLGKKALGL